MENLNVKTFSRLANQAINRDGTTGERASGSKLGIDATKKLPGERFKRPWPPLIRMNEAVRKRINQFLNTKP